MHTDPALSRRRFVIGAGLAAAAVTMAVPRRLRASTHFHSEEGIVARMRADAATASITTQPVRGGIAVLMGAGGNIAVLSGPDGKVLVDAGISTARRQVSRALAGLSNDPIRYLINTHWHFDHTDGNQWLQSEGALIAAHRNVRKHLATDTYVDGWKFTFPTSPASALPTIGFSDSLSLHLNGTTIELSAFAPAHTDSDILVTFKEPDVVHVGDIWWNGHYPFIDYSTGGSVDGTIRAVESVLSRVTDTTAIIPGHGPVGTKGELAAFRDMLSTVRQRVSDMKARGTPLADIIAAAPTLEFDHKFGHFLLAPADFVTLIHAGV